MSFIFLRNRVTGGAAFSPASLFSSGEEGAWYEPSTTTCFTDTAGTTAASVGDSVALLLDKSQQQTFNARRNLLERTEEFGTSPWTGSASVTADSDTAPDGTVTADTLTDAGGVVTKQQKVSLATITNYAASVYLKKTTSAPSFPMVQVFSGASGEASVIVNTDAGSAVARTGVTQAATGISVVSDGDFWRVSFTFSFVITGTSAAFAVYPAANTDASSTYASGTTGSCVVWGAQLEAASSASAYQAVTTLPVEWAGNHATQTNPDARPLLQQTAGGLYYLAFDGADDGMATASIDFTATDKMSVFAGVEKDDEAPGQLVAETSPNVNSNNGSFYIAVNDGGGSTEDYSAFSRGTAGIRAYSDDAQPSLAVVSGLHDISAPSTILRVNGVAVDTETSTQGTGNFGNYPLNIGARNNAASGFFDGKIFSLIVRGAASTAQEISDTESYVANLSGVTLP